MHVLIVPSEHFVTQLMPLGGIFQLHQATALHLAGMRVGVISGGVVSPRFLFRSYPYRSEECLSGVNVYRKYERKYSLQRRSRPCRAVETRVRLGFELYERYTRAHGRPDVVHAHDVLLSASIARAIQVRDGIPYGVTEHSSVFAGEGFPEESRVIAGDCLRGASFVTAVSRALGRWVARVVDLDGLEIEVLPNVLDQHFVRDEARPARPDGEPRFLSVGSLDSNKDHATLIAAFARRFGGQNGRLRIAGTWPLRARLEKLCRRLGVGRQVEFLGHLDRASVRREMLMAGCLVLTSRVETFGVVLIEALACGTPVVATRCGGPEDIVRPEDGFLVTPGVPDAIGAAMAEVVVHSGNYPPERLREGCLRRYGPQAFVKLAARLYESATSTVSH
ncbi:MAG: glycosyltransferase [Pseudomonadota bacterium]